LDIGCGTGALSIIFSENLDYKNNIHCIDRNPNAIKSTSINMQIFDIYENFKPRTMDLSDAISKNMSAEILEKVSFPQKFDMIVCNPPWVNASPLKGHDLIEDGNFDPDHKYLKNVFKFVSLHMTNNKKNRKENTGNFVLIFSDLNYKLG